MMVLTRASWQPSTFGIDDHEVLWTQTTEDDCLNNFCDGSNLSHGYFSCIQLNWRVDRLEWCHHYPRVEQHGDMTACHSIQDLIIQSFMHAIIRSFNDSIIWSYDYAAFDYSIIQSFDHWITRSLDLQPFDHLNDYSVVQSYDRSRTRSFDPWITRSFDHLILWRLTVED